MSAASDAIANVPWTNTTGEITGAILQDLLNLLLQELTFNTYLYKKAINAALPAILPTAVDAMIAFTEAKNSPGSNAMQAATTNIPAPAGGDFEMLVLAPWLATLQSPPTIAQLRASATNQAP